VFAAVFLAGDGLLEAQIAGRCAALVFQYLASRRAVFLSGGPHATTLPRYLAVVAATGALSYTAISALRDAGLLAALPAKLLVESLLFLVSFFVLRDFVFTQPATAR
jgi:putative flippase GtrA